MASYSQALPTELIHRRDACSFFTKPGTEGTKLDLA
jgi:hypothetical protein